ncbi:MAG: LLM class flavin-dependent oxidoreductase, partial [Chloroflexi bacterium]|nr:LLM class flavin-dependent oxidoreductase [Chloroflexota bacterium]
MSRGGGAQRRARRQPRRSTGVQPCAAGVLRALHGRCRRVSVAFGLNRFDYSSPAAFAADARRAEALGWAWAFIPSSPLRRLDPYVMLAAVAGATERIGVGPLIETPMMRHPAVLAGSIATLDALAPGRTLVALGAGDTAVRLIGRRP